MKKYFVSAVLGLCMAMPVVSQSAVPGSFEEKISYSMGFEVGTYFMSAGGDIQKEMLIKGIEDAFAKAEPVMTREDMAATQKEFAQKMQAKQMAEMEKMKVDNMVAGQTFLEAHKAKEGVVVTESGLQYQVLKQGEGDKATPVDKVTVDYVGKLIDGTVFDSTKKRGKPAQFQVAQVIKGWGEALQLMNPGSKYSLVIPSELAYGEQGAAPTIQPNSVLVFEVELISIEKPEAAPEAAPEVAPETTPEAAPEKE